ncbi:uncharacterized protein ACHE_31406S [Aspergillus chevalieri]|uniref:ABM domain-containing protein n=1 Tax=Aspergillus chevalieri TaxID=182096 RepID=A0A7R7VMQ5_ASPCH|nr:uncharacterized protein ACHE_31406S [Aspergillus chevalieri]BCR87419.1 hypothetical protein ACHE_31406S [Aspergillus chevalieri]
MTKICEVTVLYLKPGTDLSSPENHAKYTTGIKTLTSQPGFQLLQEGRSKTEEELLVWLTDWNDLLDHETFMAKSEPYSKMVDALLSMCDTEREDFLEIKHLPPTSSFLDVTMTGTQYGNLMTTMLWLRIPEGGSLGQFAAAVKRLRRELEHRGQAVTGGGPVETPGEAILFIQSREGPLVEKEEIARILGHGANISRSGVFKLSYNT